MKKPNSYLVGGGDLPMKFIKAGTVSEAKKVWKVKTKRKDDPHVSRVTAPKKKPASKETPTPETEGREVEA